MMIRKITMAAVLTAVGLMLTTPAHAGAYLINGKWYYFSLDFEALIKATGNVIKNGTFINAQVKVLTSNSICANPNNFMTSPGQGPTDAIGSGYEKVEDTDVSRDNKTKGVYNTTTQIIDLPPTNERLNPPPTLCENNGGNGNWVPVYWQDKNCKRGSDLTFPVCYKDLAAYVGNDLYYITGTYTGDKVQDRLPSDTACGRDIATCPSWTYVFLPTVFKYHVILATTDNSGVITNQDYYGLCHFADNNEAGANYPGQPYSLDNPPVNGWAASPPATYDCDQIDSTQY